MKYSRLLVLATCFPSSPLQQPEYEEQDAGGQEGVLIAYSTSVITGPGPGGPASFVPSRLYVETLRLRRRLRRGLLVKKRERRLQRQRMMMMMMNDDDIRHDSRLILQHDLKA